MTLKQRALALARLVEVQDILGLDDREFAEFLVQEAQAMAPEMFSGPSDDDDESPVTH